MTMTTKELLALVGRWREISEFTEWHALEADSVGANDAAKTGFESSRRFARCADELAPIATALCAEAEALRKDAERYRWLRDVAPPGTGEMASVRGTVSAATIDAAIDAAKDPK